MVRSLGALVVLTAGCGTTLKAVEPAKAAKLLNPHHVQLVHEACEGSLRYADQARRILVYRLDFDDRRAVCDARGPYELVLILDHDDRVERYRLLRVR